MQQSSSSSRRYLDNSFQQTTPTTTTVSNNKKASPNKNNNKSENQQQQQQTPPSSTSTVPSDLSKEEKRNKKTNESLNKNLTTNQETNISPNKLPLLSGSSKTGSQTSPSSSAGSPGQSKKHHKSRSSKLKSKDSSSSATSSPNQQMGGCVTKNGSQVNGTPLGLNSGSSTATTGPSSSKNVMSNNLDVSSPSTQPTDGAGDINLGALKNKDRRRLSLSQSDPAKADLQHNEFRGHFHINSNQQGGGSSGISGGTFLSEAELQILAQVKAPDENDDFDDDDDLDDDVSLPSSDEEITRRAIEENKLKKKQLQSPTPQKECRRLSVSGMPSSMRQDNFENKRQEVKSDTGFFDAHTLLGLGIGYACRKGLKPESPNQDDFFIVRIDDWGLYGVFDGHGPYGHDVSNFVQRELPKLIYNNPHFISNPQEALRASFITVHNMLETAASTHNLFDCSLSGSTATVVLHRKATNKLIVGHVGDSRCVLGRLSKNGRKIEAIDLTTDHKPNSELEKKRILASGGQVRRLDGDIPYRVFLRGRLYPGLAMSRAIGDTVGTQAGVICEPDVSEHTITDRDLFISLCSDGVWEFLTSSEVVNVIHKNGINGVQTAADLVARESWNRWIQEEGNVVDDITAEIIYLNTNPTSDNNTVLVNEKSN